MNSLKKPKGNPHWNEGPIQIQQISSRFLWNNSNNSVKPITLNSVKTRSIQSTWNPIATDWLKAVSRYPIAYLRLFTEFAIKLIRFLLHFYLKKFDRTDRIIGFDRIINGFHCLAFCCGGLVDVTGFCRILWWFDLIWFDFFEFYGRLFVGRGCVQPEANRLPALGDRLQRTM